MIHEILISLSGHPSPLFENNGPQVTTDIPLLSPSEKALLRSVGHLSQLHRDIRHNLGAIQTNNKSPICKAVASAIEGVYLSKFQKKILEVETSILRHDAEFVGAYNIVPLASIVGEFSEWHRVLEWLWDVVCLIQPQQKTDLACSGPQLINRLRKSAQTGYPDVEEAAIQLSKAAELAWLRQLAEWILYGRLSKFGSVDFFIESDGTDERQYSSYHITSSRVPSFVTSGCAESILFLGNALHQLSSRSKEGRDSQTQIQYELLLAHQRVLSSLRLPVASTNLSEAVNSIRTSLSRNVLQRLLPLEDLLQVLVVIRRVLLLEYSEFGNSLIREADERLRFRSKQMTQHTIMSNSLKGLVLKESEVQVVLAKTWTHLFALAADNDEELDILEMGRDLVELNIGRSTARHEKDSARTVAESRSKNPFNQFLLPVPTTVGLRVESPFDLFISPADVSTYSSINAYLLAIRRGHMHLTDLWKQSQIRRDHPTPLGPPRSCTKAGRHMLQHRRERSGRRNIELRKVWATCSAVIFLLNEIGDYVEGQVIPSMWSHLLQWIQEGSEVTGAQRSDQSLTTSESTAMGPATAQPLCHDPATLAKAHRSFLLALSDAILLEDRGFTTALTSLLRSVDDLVAQIMRLQTIQRNLDLEEDDGVFDAMGNYEQDLADCTIELDRARKRADAGTRDVVARLKDISSTSSSSIHNAHVLRQEQGREADEYEPVSTVKVEWLLMKLEYSNGSGDGDGDDLGDEY